MGLGEFIQKKKNKKAEIKSRNAYDLMVTRSKYATSNEFMIRLQGDIEYFKPFLERIRIEGYDYRLDIIDGELFSPTIIYVSIKKHDAFVKKDEE